MFNTIFLDPIKKILLLFYGLTGSLGIAIIALTLVIRIVLIPFTLPSMKSAAKMRDLKPELDKIKKKHKSDKVKQQQSQVELFKKHKLNPAAGCLPQIAQFVVLIALYRVFIDILSEGYQGFLSTQFLWMDLTQPDPLYLLPIIAAFSQLILGLMVLPGADTSAEKALAISTKDKKDDKEAQDMSQMATTMQQQMVYVMPFMTLILATRFPSGLALYWTVSTIFSIIQQYFVSGSGGLTTRVDIIRNKMGARNG